VKRNVHNALSELGGDDDTLHVMREAVPTAGDARLGRIMRIDRGWSTIRTPDPDVHAAHRTMYRTVRVRNVGADVCVGDWVVLDPNDERIEFVAPRRSALMRRASSDDMRAVPQAIAANLDTVILVHAVTNEPNPRRLERELVLAYDSGARPVIVLTKCDAVDPAEAERMRNLVAGIAVGVPVHVVSALQGVGLDALHIYGQARRTIVVLGASGVGKSTLVNALVETETQLTGEVRDADQRGRHTTVAVTMLQLPSGGWLIDTPGVRAVSLWTSGHGIERAFADVFALMDSCRFRDCKHVSEPGCAVRAAVAAGSLDEARLESMRRLVAEEAALEEEQREFERQSVRRVRRGGTRSMARSERIAEDLGEGDAGSDDVVAGRAANELDADGSDAGV
jgi:ribosome biogenesis GTPase